MATLDLGIRNSLVLDSYYIGTEARFHAADGFKKDDEMNLVIEDREKIMDPCTDQLKQQEFQIVCVILNKYGRYLQ